MALSTLDWLVYPSFILILGVIGHRLRQSRSQSLPPGPPPKPLIGNYLDVPKAEPWRKFSQWSKLYGDLVYVNVLGNKLLILNDMESMRELLEKRSQKYSDRASFLMANYMGIENNLSFAPYGPDWRQGRKLIHGTVNQEAVQKYHSLQEDVAARFLRNLVENPSGVMKHLHMASAHIIASITYGFSIDTPSNVYFDEFAETERIVLKSVVPGAYLVDMIPQLWYLPSWVPFNSIRRTAETGRQRVSDIVHRPIEQVEQDMKQGASSASFVSDHLRNGGSDEAIRQLLPWVAWSIYEAGNDTTAGTMLVFMHAMACFPEVQARMREEIHRVVGTDRLPTFVDRGRLPYINAAIKEVYRWNPNSPLGAPRKLQDADVYRAGYYIPKGTIVMPNVWLLSRDQDSGIDPEAFSPERFLETHVQKTAIDPYSYAFGFGRRMCPGRFLADNSVFMLVTSMLATVRISKPKDSYGVEKLFDPPYIPAGLASFPYPFEVDIEPVSDKAVAVVKGIATSIN
ncbi:cytochrome P450 [Suillus clintonianus]|uniref:cytochrome P450 n=1 Tax=Suillus clintonianus TaxID=1904413 RepID=UPI001B87FF91|nr:cytochrome P450 [Suillus clintonianus]KAG2130907.1 cytochrome P450 [Suillus clintonianus]